MTTSGNLLQNYFSRLYIPRITWTDIIEIIIIAVVLYNILLWIMNTKAWALLKGIIVVGLFAVVAYLLNLKTILWIAGKTISVGIIALVIIFQPELRRALEQLGRKKFVLNFLNFGDNSNKDERFSVKTADEIVDACYRMGAVRTGALIVIEQDMLLEEYIKTGIPVDGIVTSQLLINIFEKNTPLHDGAVIIEGDEIVAATCYIPLSDSTSLSKELGTRHRAGLGLSELTDSIIIIVSEETGSISIAKDGKLIRYADAAILKNELTKAQAKDEVKTKKKIWKGRNRNEKSHDEN